MTMKLIETHSEGDYTEIETFQCTDCGRRYSVYSGGDIACCECEYEQEAELMEEDWDKEDKETDARYYEQEAELMEEDWDKEDKETDARYLAESIHEANRGGPNEHGE